MDNVLITSVLHICSVLQKHSVQYLIVGGTAVALHGYFRSSTNSNGLPAAKHDLDVWYNPTYDNYFRLLNVLEELGEDVTEFKEEQTPDPYHSFFRFEHEQFTLDLLPVLKAEIKFRSAFQKKEIANFNGVDIQFISFNDLIQDKEANSRPKDVEDIKHLKGKQR